MVLAGMLTLCSSAVGGVMKSSFGDLWVGGTGQVSVYANAIQVLEFSVSLKEIQTGLVDLIVGDFKNEMGSLFPFSAAFLLAIHHIFTCFNRSLLLAVKFVGGKISSSWS